MSEERKTCSNCEEEKSIDNFYFTKNRNKFTTQCKNCILKKQIEYNQNNTEKIKQYKQNNREKIATQQTEYKQNNREKIATQSAEYYQNNKEKIKQYKRNRYKNNENARLIQNLRTRIYKTLNGKSKSVHAKEILGIDIETYKRWIKYQMTEEMNFNNIHIDHVKPISSFDISNDNELLEAFNWRNTQPLLKQDNLRKSNKFNEKDYNNQFIKAREFNLLQTFLSETNHL